MKVKIFCLIFAIGLNIAKSDLPVDCHYDKVVGKWLISESDRRYGPYVACDSIGAFTNQFIYTLKYPNIVVDEEGNNGTWTLIYNQGFEFTINARSHFATFSYVIIDSDVISYCSNTTTGLSHDVTVRNWACYTANKLEEVKPTIKPLNRKKIGSQQYRNDHLMVKRINSAQSLWTAKVYPEFEKYTVYQMQRRMGTHNNKLNETKYLGKESSKQKSLKDFPDSFDWRHVLRNKTWQNYVSEVRDQRLNGCGSCYAFASMGALEARIRIKTNNHRSDIFSPQDILDCSELSEGCDGGFNYLIAGRYAKEYGVIEERFNKYKGREQPCNEKLRSTAPKTYVSNYHYVGGYYGGCSEELMIEELLRDGPLPVLFNVYGDFPNYKEGIYRYTGIRSKYDPFVLADHAVLFVGYGTDPSTGQKYWTCKNSWGKSWGEDGYFSILRGVDESGIESAAFNFDIIP